MADSTPPSLPASATGDDDAEASLARWRSTCIVPAHPSQCPMCQSRVKIFHLNLSGDALFLCKNKQCFWPLKYTPSQFMGTSDVNLYQAMHYEGKQRKKTKRKQQKSQLPNGITLDRLPTPPPDHSPDSQATIKQDVVMGAMFPFSGMPNLISPIPRSPTRVIESSLLNVESEKPPASTNLSASPLQSLNKIEKLRSPAKVKSTLHDVESEKQPPPDSTNLSAVPLQRFTKVRHLEQKKMDKVKLLSLSNKLAKVTGLPISVDVPVQDDPGGQDQDMISEIRELTNKVATFEENQEFRSLIKAMGGSDKDNLDFIQKIQRTLLSSNGSSCDRADPKVVRLFVGQGKSTIDLPNQTLNVSSHSDQVQVLLCSESDGIEGEALRECPRELADLPPPFRHRRGRKKKVRTPSPSPTLVPPAQTAVGSPHRFNPVMASEEAERKEQMLQMDQQKIHQQQSCYMFFCYPKNLEYFTSVISQMMEGYVHPEHYRAQGINPVVAMLFNRMNEPNNNPGAVATYQRLMEMYPVYLLLGAPLIANAMSPTTTTTHAALQSSNISSGQQPINLFHQVGTSSRTYQELQTVRSHKTTTDVLREHQTRLESANLTEQTSVNLMPPPPPPTSKPAAIKGEVMEYLERPFNPESVQMSSVHSSQTSVREVAGHLPQAGVVGRGKKMLSFNYESTVIGPIQVDTDEETRALVAFVKEQISDKNNRGKQLVASPRQYYSEAVRARSILRPEVIKYVQRAFTQRGLKENVVGRKKRNYTKRSEIIKIDPKTGERIFPAMKVQTIMEIKKGINEEELRQSECEAAQASADSAKAAPFRHYPNLSSPRGVKASIDQILSNTADTHPPPVIDLDPDDSRCLRASTTLGPTFLLASKTASAAQEEWEQEERLSKRRTRSMAKGEGRSKKKERLKTFTNKKWSAGTVQDNVKAAPTLPTPSTAAPSPLTLSNLFRIDSMSVAVSVKPAANTGRHVPTSSGQKFYKGFQSKLVSPRTSSSQPPGKEALEEMISKTANLTACTEVTPNSDWEATPNKRSRISPKSVIDATKLLTWNQSKGQSVPKIPLMATLATWTATAAAAASSSSSADPPNTNVFFRQSQEKRTQKLMKKQLKKRIYRGFGADRAPAAAEVAKSSSRLSKFTAAQMIGGVKKIIRANGEIVEIWEEKEVVPPPKPKYVAPIAKEEKDLLD